MSSRREHCICIIHAADDQKDVERAGQTILGPIYSSVALYLDSDVQRSIAGSGLYNNTGLVRHDAWTGGQTNSERGEQSTQPQWSIDCNSTAVTDYGQQQEQRCKSL
jgi:hypothetical protein